MWSFSGIGWEKDEGKMKNEKEGISGDLSREAA
jgi:hypothetical protein